MKRKILVSFVMFAFVFCVNTCYAGVEETKAPIQIGNPIPSIELPSVTGNAINTDSLKDSAMLLTFFSTWSKPCLDNLLAIQQLSEKFKGLKVVAVSFDKKSAAVDTFLKNNGLDLTCLIDKKQKYLDTFHILMIPTTFLVDKNGNLKKVYIDYDDSFKESMTADIIEVLAEKKVE